eukprot:CAMPEP_0171196084 /NCGR_PEP_ID=MMETSP0790-20130122/21722_1 /TAXON_ID=2925 /ORGANISM="Alexandrium catenella, Strain OF101" /LENGTH=50 /DNA_ID=CAMNT_0011661301 /DNA_START=29 /DNA_END=179 /DNA_ORIENTATION=+
MHHGAQRMSRRLSARKEDAAAQDDGAPVTRKAILAILAEGREVALVARDL